MPYLISFLLETCPNLLLLRYIDLHIKFKKLVRYIFFILFYTDTNRLVIGLKLGLKDECIDRILQLAKHPFNIKDTHKLYPCYVGDFIHVHLWTLLLFFEFVDFRVFGVDYSLLYKCRCISEKL